jgi:hypothetical protein
MRRGSLIGPLLIVLIGIAFLINSLRPGLPMLEIAAMYWPFLLIVWGALRLAEILYWAARSRPLPRAGIGSGEWTLVIFVCLIGSGLYAANRFRPWQHMGFVTAKRVEMFGRTYDFPIPEQPRAAGKSPKVLVENLQGNIRISGADTTDVRISGRKTVRALQESDAAKAAGQSPVEVSAQGDQIVVRTNLDRVTGEQKVSADLEIVVPRMASIQGRGRQGDFDITGLDGSVEISSDNAGVRLSDIGGNVRLDLRRSDLIRAINVKGAVELSGGRGRDIELENIGGEVTVNGFYSGDLKFRKLARSLRLQGSRAELRVERVPGTIHMDLADFRGAGLVGPVRFSSRSRDVQLEDFSQALELSVERGDISLRPLRAPMPALNVRTGSGRLDLALPESARFQLKAMTGRGEVNNDFGPPLRAEAERGEARGGSIEGAIGDGPVLTLSTGRGSITVRKEGVAPPARMKQRELEKTSVEISLPDGTLTVQKH